MGVPEQTHTEPRPPAFPPGRPSASFLTGQKKGHHSPLPLMPAMRPLKASITVALMRLRRHLTSRTTNPIGMGKSSTTVRSINYFNWIVMYFTLLRECYNPHLLAWRCKFGHRSAGLPSPGQGEFQCCHRPLIPDFRRLSPVLLRSNRRVVLDGDWTGLLPSSAREILLSAQCRCPPQKSLPDHRYRNGSPKVLSSTGKRHSSTSGSVRRELVIWVWTASVPWKARPSPRNRRRWFHSTDVAHCRR